MRIDRPSGSDAPDEGDRSAEVRESAEPFGPRSEIERRDEWAAQAQAVKEDRAQNPRRVFAKASEAETTPEPATDAGRREDSGREQKPDDKPEDRGWRTLTEEFGEARAFRTFDAARNASIREHGPRPGQDLHHLVERSQQKPERSGFPAEKIHSSDNLTWIDRDVHNRITASYNRHVPGLPVRLRDTLDGTAWEHQYQRGSEILDQEMRRRRDGDD